MLGREIHVAQYMKVNVNSDWYYVVSCSSRIVLKKDDEAIGRSINRLIKSVRMVKTLSAMRSPEFDRELSKHEQC